MGAPNDAAPKEETAVLSREEGQVGPPGEEPASLIPGAKGVTEKEGAGPGHMVGPRQSWTKAQVSQLSGVVGGSSPLQHPAFWAASAIRLARQERSLVLAAVGNRGDPRPCHWPRGPGLQLAQNDPSQAPKRECF